jgi:hypothetical protein
MRRCKEVDVHGYWANHSQLINVIAFEGNAEDKASKETWVAPSAKMAATQEPFNYYEHLENAKQLGETPSEFVRRLPPLTSNIYPWLWVANPYAPRDKEPEAMSNDKVGYIKEMQHLMLQYLEKKRTLTGANPNMPAGTITRKLHDERERLNNAIIEGAHKVNMTCGKVGRLLHYSLFDLIENL